MKLVILALSMQSTYALQIKRSQTYILSLGMMLYTTILDDF